MAVPAEGDLRGLWLTAFGCLLFLAGKLSAEFFLTRISIVAVLAVFDLETHRAIAHVPLPRGADVVKFDPGLGRVYVACSVGAISVIQEDDPDHFRKVEDVPVQRKVHSLEVDLRTHRVYAPEEQENGEPIARLLIFEAVDSRRN